MIELLVEGQAVDIAPKTKITLNFNSNIFGDISKITASNSFTINLPKTPNNSRIFGAPMNSNAPYRKWNAQLFVNGVAVVDAAHLVILSVGENYEVALYWGVVTELLALKESDKTLRDINEVLRIQYGGTNWWNSYADGEKEDGSFTDDIIYYAYNSGVGNLRTMSNLRGYVADYPFVRASWLWEQIVKDNNLNVSLSDNDIVKMHTLGVPFLTRDVVEQQTTFVAQFLKTNIIDRGGDYGATVFQLFEAPEVSSVFTFANVNIPMTIGGKTQYFTATAYKAIAEHTCTFKAKVKVGYYRHWLSLLYSDGATWNESQRAEVVNGEVELTRQYEMKVGDMVCIFVRGTAHGINLQGASLVVTPQGAETAAVFGAKIDTRKNLPEIKQMDFIKAMCQMQGWWTTLINGTIHIQSYDTIYDNEPLDWSRKLVGSGDGDAEKTTFTINDYAQENILRYKEDKTTDVDASGALVVEDTTLDKKKDMLTLPFAASEGDIIPRLKWKNDDPNTGVVEAQKVEPRIMNLPPSFSGLSFAELLKSNYGSLQRIIRKPIVIEEKINLSEIDVKNLDYRKPIYLQKYGAMFAIDKVQWSEGEAASVTLVMLPPKQQIQAALPYKVTTGVTIGTDYGVTKVPTPIEPAAKYVTGAGEYWGENAVVELIDNDEYGFDHWTDVTGRTISYDNPYIYDGSRGDIVLYANCTDKIIIG